MKDEMPPGDGTNRGGPLDRYMSVLELVAAFPGTITMSDVGSLLDLPKTSAHRLLGGLVRAGLIEGGGRNKTFRLGDRLVRLAHSSTEDGWIAALARPQLDALVEATGETCYLTRLIGHRVLVVVSASPEVQWRSYVRPGIEMPPHAAATAKVIMAFQPEPLIARALAGDLPAFTSQTCTDAARVRREYQNIPANGYATCIAEIDEGLGALGVPITVGSGAVLYSLGMTGPVQRIMNHEMPGRIESLTLAASALSQALSLGTAIAARAPAA